jgi:hypothetical protein
VTYGVGAGHGMVDHEDLWEPEPAGPGIAAAGQYWRSTAA